MKLDFFSVSRIALLLFVTLIAIFFIMESRDDAEESDAEVEPSKVVEKYAEADTAETAAAPKKDTRSVSDIEKRIKYAYEQMYNMAPSTDELNFYVAYATSKKLTEADLRDVISTTAPTLRKSLSVNNLYTASLKVIGTEAIVFKLFDEYLERSPSRGELYKYSLMLKKGENGFNEEKFKQLLLTSEEYQRIQKLQSNRAFVGLRGDITDRQVSMDIMEIYEALTGNQYIDEVTMAFLKKKYSEVEFDKNKMRAFILNFVLDKKIDASEETLKKKLDELKARQAAVEKEKEALQSTETSSKEEMVNFLGGEIKKTNQELVDNMSKGGSVQMPYYASSGAKTAAYINERGMRHLKNVCERNKAFWSAEEEMAGTAGDKATNKTADKDMILMDGLEWTVPMRVPPVCVGGANNYNPSVEQTALIGTLLSDSKSTSVGSILPKNPPV